MIRTIIAAGTAFAGMPNEKPERRIFVLEPEPEIVVDAVNPSGGPFALFGLVQLDPTPVMVGFVDVVLKPVLGMAHFRMERNGSAVIF